MNFFNRYDYIEKKLFPINRFPILSNENKEISKDLNKSRILLIGACGSIGRSVCSKLIKHNFESLVLLDKNENELADLNRALIVLLGVKRINKVSFICTDITSTDVGLIINKFKISHYLNLAAMKHVRSEEELESLKYMIKTNSINFLTKKNRYLKKIFSVSSDKAVNPTSILGVSKMLMENNLYNFKNKNKKVFTSSARFANVTFSNGSVLQYALEKMLINQSFGIPKKIKRYFITHDEASNICLKSLLKKNDGFIIFPSDESIGSEILITDIIKKIISVLKIKNYNYKYKFSNSLKGKNIFLTSPNTHGQKYYEEFSSKSEKIFPVEDDSSLNKCRLERRDNLSNILDKIIFSNNIDKIKNYLEKNISSYKYPKRVKSLKKTI